MLPSYYLLFVFGFWKPCQGDTPVCSVLNQNLQMTAWIGFPIGFYCMTKSPWFNALTLCMLSQLAYSRRLCGMLSVSNLMLSICWVSLIITIYSFTFACVMLKLLHSKTKECVTDCSPDHTEYLSICQIPINLNDRSRLQNYGDVMLLSIKFTTAEKVCHKEQRLPTNFICFMIGITNFVP